MSEWAHAETDPEEELAKLHHFSMVKRQDGRAIEFMITVREYVPGADASKRFVAQADKQTNQRTAPYTPMGWGHTLSKALSECVKAVHRFPYEGEEGG